MEFIDLLKYGAIGISLALAILSYRLLSKEQDKTQVREPMLKSIRNYFALAVFLSVFFGVSEIASKVIFEGVADRNLELNKIWKSHFSEFKDSTFEQKSNRISENLDIAAIKIDPLIVCKDLSQELSDCKERLGIFDNGFYQNLIKLKKEISKNPDGWVNIDFQTSAKANIINSLKEIFKSLGYNYDEITDKEIVEKWKLLKSKWASEKVEYIFLSDISGIVKEFIKTYN